MKEPTTQEIYDELTNQSSKEKPVGRKFEKIDFGPLTITPTGHTSEQWDEVIAHVDMPIQVRNASVTIACDPNSSEILPQPINVNYMTDTGRDGKFQFVMIDRWNSGEFLGLAAITDRYTAFAPKVVYEQLRETLDSIEGIQYEIASCYNSYSGGAQILNIDVKHLEHVQFDGIGDLTMRIQVGTSLDCKRRHTVSVLPRTSDNTPIYFTDTSKGEFGLNTIHTGAAAERVADFNTVIGGLIQHWNTNIAPAMSFIMDGNLTERETAAFLKGIIDQSGLPKSAKEELMRITHKDDAFSGVKKICSTIANGKSPITIEKQAATVGKEIANRVSKLLEKKVV